MVACDVCGNTNQNHLEPCRICGTDLCCMCRHALNVPWNQDTFIRCDSFYVCSKCQTLSEAESVIKGIVDKANSEILACIQEWKRLAEKKPCG